MILTRIFRTYTFRYALFYVVVLSVSGFIILALLYGSFSYDYFNDVHGSITAELDNLDERYQREGIEGVRQYVEEKNTPGTFNKFYYLLVDENYNFLAGNLSVWPKFRTYVDGWLSFELDVLKWRGRTSDDFVGRSRDLGNGYHLLAARHYNDVIERIKLVAGTLSQSMLVTIMLGVLGAAIISADMLRRVDSINRSIQTIMAGNLSERISVTRRGGDFDRLANNLNRMLDRIEVLMTGVRQVSDNIAHDLRTPLTRLRNSLAQLERNRGEDAEELVQSLIGEADSLLSTFNALLRIAQVESGNRRSGFGMIDLHMLILDVEELYEPLAADKGVRIAMELEADVKLSGDRDLLFQMCANLIDNAIKYTPAGGQINVSLTKSAEQAHLVISDSGIGIPASDRDKVFQRFYRVEESRGQEPGNGLGLSLVAAVMKLHYGEIQLADNRPGLSVIVNLPL
jgi:signal transduction histidine kinase